MKVKTFTIKLTIVDEETKESSDLVRIEQMQFTKPKIEYNQRHPHESFASSLGWICEKTLS